MKIKKATSFGLIACILCVAAPMLEALPFAETFNNDPAGNLGGQLNAEGNPWTPMGTNGTTGTADVTVTNFNLAYPGLECPGTNSVLFGYLGYTERVAINPPVGTNAFGTTGGTIYYSYVFYVTNVAQLTSSGAFVSAFTTVTGTSATQPTVGGARLYMKLSSINPSAAVNVGIGKNPASPSFVTWATNEINVGDTNFIVAAYTFFNSGASNDVASMWVNPNSNTFGAVFSPPPDVTNTNGTDVQVSGANQIESFYLRQGNSSIPLVLASNLRLGYYWGCVTPPSDPGPISEANMSLLASGTNLTLSWGTNAPCFTLQSATSLASPFTNVVPLSAFTLDATSNAYTNIITLQSNSPTSKFYRLKQVAN
jgi:hypothetical protein